MKEVSSIYYSDEEDNRLFCIFINNHPHGFNKAEAIRFLEFSLTQIRKEYGLNGDVLKRAFLDAGYSEDSSNELTSRYLSDYSCFKIMYEYLHCNKL